MNKVVVTGLGFITSIGNDKKKVLNNLKNLNHGIEFDPKFSGIESPVKLFGKVKNFNIKSNDPEDWVFPKQYSIKREVLRSIPPHGLYAYCSIIQAIKDSNLSLEEISNPKTGIFTASAGSIKMMYHHLKKMHKVGPMRCSPLGIVSSIAGTLNFNLVSAFKIKGSSCGFVSACASSAHALGYAFNEIYFRKQERMIVVGAEDGDHLNIVPFCGMRALSTSDNPKKGSCPFDRNRSGFVGTGGSSAIIIESYKAAKKRKARIYAEFKGWGQSSDGYNVAISHPKGSGLIRSMKNALQNSKTLKNEIKYVNAHATSTPIGDLSEIRAIKNIFNKKNNIKQNNIFFKRGINLNKKLLKYPLISSTKALTGHGLSLSSVMESAFSILSIYNGFIPGSAHIKNLDQEADGLNIIKKSVDINKKRRKISIMSNSSGFGGANVSLIFLI
jgi:3-oxoacyl-[acyl-carrier-protein] synthase-1